MDIDGFTKDGVSIEIFRKLLDFVYTGTGGANERASGPGYFSRSKTLRLKIESSRTETRLSAPAPAICPDADPDPGPDPGPGPGPKTTSLGSEDVIPESPNDITELVVAAERVGVTQLVRLCERDLIVFLANDTEGNENGNENARALSDFARAYNLRRLARHIDATLALS